LSNVDGNISSFIEPDGTSYTLQTPTVIETTTRPSFYQFPEWMYLTTVNVETSLSDTETKSFVSDVLSGAPEEITSGLKYQYNLVTPATAGRYLSTRVTGLKMNEEVLEIRTELERNT
jgi:hypothetical protein